MQGDDWVRGVKPKGRKCAHRTSNIEHRSGMPSNHRTIDVGTTPIDNWFMPTPKTHKNSAAAKKRRRVEKLPSMAELKRRLAAGAETAVARAKANSPKLIGREML